MLRKILVVVTAFVAVSAQPQEKGAGKKKPSKGDKPKPPGINEIDDGVLVLTDANFDEEVAKYDNMLVEFYAPWCGHCKKLAPEFAKASATLKEEDPPIMLAKVDCTENKALKERFEIKSFPTLQWKSVANNGEFVKYTGGRTEQTIVGWTMKATGQWKAITDVDCAALEVQISKLKDPSTILLAYFGAQDGLLNTIFTEFAEREAAFKFIRLDESATECAAKYGVEMPGLALFRVFDSPVEVFSETLQEGGAARKQVTEWAKSLMTPTVMEFSRETHKTIMEGSKPSLILFRFDKKAGVEMQTLQAVAAEYKSKVNFVFSFVFAEQNGGGKFGESLGVTKKEQLPTYRLIDPREKDADNRPKLKKYLNDDIDPMTVTAEELKKFIDDVLAGSVEPYLKSEEAGDMTAALPHVVGTNFEEMVLDETKDVFVKYYAPWCGHCKKLAPIWEELAELHKDNADLVIAEFDSTANENIKAWPVKSFPTMVLYPKGNKEGIHYTGGRELADFTKYLEEQGLGQSAVKDDL